MLKKAPLPKDVEFGADGIVKLLRKGKLRAVEERTHALIATAKRSIGLVSGNCVRMDL